MAERPAAPHIVILPSPGVGHLVPFAELVRRIVSHHGFTSTLLLLPSTTASLPTSEIGPFLATLPPGVTTTSLTASPSSDVVYPDDLPSDTDVLEGRLTLTIVRCLPSIRNVLTNGPSPPKALIADMFGTDALRAAREAGVPGYVFFPMSSMAWLLGQHQLNNYQSRAGLPEEPVLLPGSIPLFHGDLPHADHQPDVVRSWIIRSFTRCLEADGILLNTFESMEPGAVEYFRKEIEPSDPRRPRVFPIGPLSRDKYPTSVLSGDRHRCLEWLDAQPPGSVLYVSFGSGGTLSAEQLMELAAGLEASEQRFLWVVRAPSSDGEASHAAFFGDRASDDNPAGYLPEGFLDRTRGTGMVLPSWAPQLAILEHEATGGFLTHCGWNSVVEALNRGVPMIAWPLYAEQNLNAALLVRGVKIAIRPKVVAAGQVVRREEIARVIKALMVGKEGQEVRLRVRELQEAGQNCLGEGGSSTMVLRELAEIWSTGLVPHECVFATNGTVHE